MQQPSKKLNAELEQIKQRGVTLPRNPHLAGEQINQMISQVESPGGLASDIRGLPTGSTDQIRQLEQNATMISQFNRSRLGGNMHLGNLNKLATAGGGGDVQIAIPRFYDPLEYWDLSGLPWNMADEGHRHKLHKWLRLFAATHYLVPILIDIFTRFPLVGANFAHKDKKIVEAYDDMFFDRLDYEEFLTQLGREYWTVGEAWPLGSFDESLGIWEREELLNPESILVENNPFMGTQQFKVIPPDYMKRLVQTKSPPRDYKQLQMNYPSLVSYLRRGEPFPVTEVLLKQVAFKVSPWDDHGTPILLRGLRTLLHEEKLLASQDAIAERLYSPLILAKLGIASLGDKQGPWIPGPDQLDAFRDDMDIALSSDFRVLVHHFALEIENVFGREQVPDLGNDFDRIERRLMQVFGINPSLLSAGQNAQPYASSALQAEFMNQILRTYQKFLKHHFRQRALIVAEAQGHYEYEKKGDTRVPIFEQVIEFDEDGTPRVEKRNKLLVPDLEFASLDLRDEATERQFLQTLRAMGVPISDQHLMVGVSFNFKDSLDEMQTEMIQKTVAQQQAKLQTYKILQTQGLPIPPDLLQEVQGNQPGNMAPPPPPGGGGMPGGGDMGPEGGPGGMVLPDNPPGIPALGPDGQGGPVPGGGPPPAGPVPPGSAGTVPDVSNERRPGMPSMSSVASSDDLVEPTLPRERGLAILSHWAQQIADESAAMDAKDAEDAEEADAREPD